MNQRFQKTKRMVNARIKASVVGVALLIRSAKLGHLPVWVNAVIPMTACWAGVGLGLCLLYRRWKVTLGLALAVVAVTLWGWLGGAPATLSRDTETQLRRLVAAGPTLPSGEDRFGALLQAAFAPLPENLTVEAFRSFYGGVGSPRYRRKVGEIEARLDRGAALAPPEDG